MGETWRSGQRKSPGEMHSSQALKDNKEEVRKKWRHSTRGNSTGKTKRPLWEVRAYLLDFKTALSELWHCREGGSGCSRTSNYHTGP